MHPVILVAGASGGLGASTLAVVTATVLARTAPCVLVDADLGSGGLDATAAVEHVEGLRWGDLVDHEGAADGAGLRRALPEGPVPLLAARGRWPSPRTVTDVVTALAATGPVLVDLPTGPAVPRPWLELADSAVALVGLRARWLRDGEVLVAGLGDLGERTLLVTRGSRRGERLAARVGDHLGLAHAAHLVDDPGVRRDEANGRAPRPRGRVGEVARTVAELLPGRSRDATTAVGGDADLVEVA